MIRKLLLVVLLGALLLLPACSTTDVTNVWFDKQYTGGPVKKVLVLGVFKIANIRRGFEDEVVARFAEKNIEAVASYRIFSLSELAEKEAIAAKIQASDFDSVIVSKVVDTRVKESISKSYRGTPYDYSGRWDSYYARSMGQVRSPAYTSPLVPVYVGTAEVDIRNIYSLETNLYKVVDKGLVSSIMSDIYTGQPHDLMIRSFVKILMKRYSSDGLI